MIEADRRRSANAWASPCLVARHEPSKGGRFPSPALLGKVARPPDLIRGAGWGVVRRRNFGSDCTSVTLSLHRAIPASRTRSGHLPRFAEKEARDGSKHEEKSICVNSVVSTQGRGREQPRRPRADSALSPGQNPAWPLAKEAERVDSCHAIAMTLNSAATNTGGSDDPKRARAVRRGLFRRVSALAAGSATFSPTPSNRCLLKVTSAWNLKWTM